MLRLICFLVAVAVPLAGQAVKVVLVGDSTVNDEGGWGTGFRACFGREVQIVNLALNGRSSKSFRDEGAWAKVMPRSPTTSSSNSATTISLARVPNAKPSPAPPIGPIWNAMWTKCAPAEPFPCW